MAPRHPLLKGVTFAALLVLACVGLAMWRLSVITPAPPVRGHASLYDLTVSDLDGHAVPLATYQGQVVLVVNVASECSLAVQYPGLDALYRRYKDRGFVVLAFPSNDFWQEPHADAEIQQVCDARGVSFPVFAKSHVRGAARSPVYAFLSSTGETPLWNFAKYLVGRDGRARAFFGSLVSPDSPTLAGAIERALAEPATLADRN
jgi:glutathione peroxidase